MNARRPWKGLPVAAGGAHDSLPHVVARKVCGGAVSTRAEGADGGSEVVRLRQRTPFTMVDNPIIRQITDYVALGLYLDMLSYPPGWRLNLRELARTHKQGRTVLAAAVNDLIERGLVFRIRYQHAGGQWATRTYVCARPVTLEELEDVRHQYAGRCRIETRPELADQLTIAESAKGPVWQAELDGAPPTPPDPGHSGHSDRTGQGGNGWPVYAGTENRAYPQVTPKTRNPALGEPPFGTPASGTPDLREPGNGVPAPQEQDPKPKIPPPPPAGVTTGRSSKGGRTDEKPSLEPPAHSHTAPDTDGLSYLEMALVDAWPSLGRKDLHRLRPQLRDAAALLDEERLRMHLTTNTGGARNPAKIIAARLDNLPLPRPRRPRLPQWCGECVADDYRWIQDDDGRPIGPCPRCSPQAIAG